MTLDRLGISSKWKSQQWVIEYFNERLADGFDAEELERLIGYSDGKQVIIPSGIPDVPDRVMSFTSAQNSLVWVAASQIRHATIEAFAGDQEWINSLRRGVTYDCWSLRMNYRWHVLAQQEFERGARKQKLVMMNMISGAQIFATTLMLGWVNTSIVLGDAD